MIYNISKSFTKKKVIFREPNSPKLATLWWSHHLRSKTTSLRYPKILPIPKLYPYSTYIFHGNPGGVLVTCWYPDLTWNVEVLSHSESPYYHIHLPCLSDQFPFTKLWTSRTGPGNSTDISWYPRIAQCPKLFLNKKPGRWTTSHNSFLLLCSARGIYLARGPIVGPDNTCAHLRGQHGVGYKTQKLPMVQYSMFGAW